MTFWLGFAAGLVVEGLAIWAIVAWSDRQDRKKFDQHFDDPDRRDRPRWEPWP